MEIDKNKIKYWYHQFKESKQVWARVKEQCPEVKTFSNRKLERFLFIESTPKDLNIVLPCNRVLTHTDLFLKGVNGVKGVNSGGLECNCKFKDVVNAIYLKFDWVNYMIYTKSTLKYVGHTTDLKQRLSQHLKHKKFIPETDTIFISVILSEQTLFNLYSPTLNKSECLNTLARVRNEQGVFVSKTINVSDNSNGITDYTTNMEKYIEQCNSLQTWCYDSRNQVCSCKPACCIRKYYNMYYGKPKYDPIPAEFVNDIYKYPKPKKEIVYLPVENIFDIYNTIKTRKPGLKPSTLKTIESIGILPDLKFPFLCISALQKRYTISTIKKMIGYVLSYCSVLTPSEKIQVFGDPKNCMIYYKTKFIMDKLELNEKEKGQLTKNEEQNWVSYETLLTVLDKLKEKDLQKYVVLYLYLHQNTLRSDFFNLKWKNIDKTVDNFIDWDKRFIILNNPLKVSTFQAYSLKGESFELLKTFKDTFTDDHSEYLFVKKNGTAFDAKSFSQYILLFIETELYGLGIYHKKIGIQMLRKIVVSHRRNSNLDVIESIQLAKDMNHSEYMSKFYYYKK